MNELKLRGDEPWHVSQTQLEIIADYLQGNRSVANAADHLDKLRPRCRPLRDAEEAETDATFIYNFWGTFVEIALQVPYDSAAATHFDLLLKELSKLPTTTNEVRALESSLSSVC